MVADKARPRVRIRSRLPDEPQYRASRLSRAKSRGRGRPGTGGRTQFPGPEEVWILPVRFTWSARTMEIVAISAGTTGSMGLR